MAGTDDEAKPDPLEEARALAEVVACAGLLGRAGAKDMELGYTGDDDNPRWYVQARYQGTRLIAQDHASPATACQELVHTLLRSALCRCGRRVTFAYKSGRCLWRLVVDRWEPGCDVAPLVMPKGSRGDLAAMRRAVTNRRS